MSDPIYPNDDLDSADALSSALGSFWTGTYGGRAQVAALLSAVLRTARQARSDLAEVNAGVALESTPLHHVDLWRRFIFLDSEFSSALPVFGSSEAGFFGADRFWGQPVSDTPRSIAVDTEVLPFLCDDTVDPDICLVDRIDYTLSNGQLTFTIDPFVDSRFTPRPIFDTDGEVIDRELVFWAFRSKSDRRDLYLRHGYALGVTGPSSPAYRDMLSALQSALVAGPTTGGLAETTAAICGVSLADGVERVELIGQDDRGQFVATDRRIIRLGASAVPVVSVGDVPSAGDSFCNALTIYEPTGAAFPDTLVALPVVVGPIGRDRRAGTVHFEDRTVPVSVDSDVFGNTRVRFPLGGTPRDVNDFWAEVHARGIADVSLAQRLDVRPNPTGEPTASSLPATINPLSFLLTRLLRGNIVCIRIIASALPASRLDLSRLRVLRRLIPPHVHLIILIEMTACVDCRRVGSATESVLPLVRSFQIATDAQSSPADGPSLLRVVGT